MDDLALFDTALEQSDVATVMSGDFTAYRTGPGAITVDPSDWVQEGMRVEMTAPDYMGYQWYLNGSPIADDERISGSQEKVLVLDPVALTDAGTYTCVYDDNMGGSPLETTAFELEVLEADGVPVAGIGAIAALAALLGTAGCPLGPQAITTSFQHRRDN